MGGARSWRFADGVIWTVTPKYEGAEVYYLNEIEGNHVRCLAEADTAGQLVDYVELLIEVAEGGVRSEEE